MSTADRDKWDALHAAAGEPGTAPAWLERFADRLPTHGTALDLAAGSGRIARWAASRGLSVAAVDISPIGLARIAHPRVRTVQQDLELDPRLPAGQFALVTLFHYRQPSLQAAIAAALEPGGFLVAELATIANLERHARPSRRWLAEPDELRHFASALTLVHYEEGWLDDRHTARLIAQRPATP
jgi:2-polyprenyl-3-methyl-5-hydroxy-6-metoxy-1,4-benzoquinol methylase